VRPYSGENLCKKCFLEAIEKKVQHTISRYGLLKPNDRVALALSGGKDSVSLLHIMSRLEEQFPRSDIVAITIDEGIEGYRSEALEIAKENCDLLDVEHRIYPFKRLYGCSLDKIVKKARRCGKPFICSYCGILRRKALNIAAREVEATKIATAHNLDDEVQSMIINILRGDIARMSRGEYDLNNDKRLVPRIKPLCKIPEKEIALYAYLKNIRFQSLPCNYLETSLRNDVRRFLNMLEDKHSGMKFTIYRSFEKILSQLNYSDKRVRGWCKICGEPTTRKICMACQTLKDLDLIDDKH